MLHSAAGKTLKKQANILEKLGLTQDVHNLSCLEQRLQSGACLRSFWGILEQPKIRANAQTDLCPHKKLSFGDLFPTCMPAYELLVASAIPKVKQHARQRTGSNETKRIDIFHENKNHNGGDKMKSC